MCEDNKMNDESQDVSKVLGVIGAGGTLGLIFGIIRGVVNQKHGGWGGLFRGMFAAIGAAILVALGIADLDLTITKQAAIIGVSAYVADDILLGLVNISKLFSNDPIGFLQNILSSLKGGKRND